MEPKSKKKTPEVIYSTFGVVFYRFVALFFVSTGLA